MSQIKRSSPYKPQWLIWLQAASQVSCLPAASWILVAVDFNKCFCSIFFCIYLAGGSGEREKLRENTFPGFKVNWSQQLNQRTGLPTVTVEVACASRRDPGPGLLIYMNHPFHLLTNTKYGNHPTHLQTHRFTEGCGGFQNWVEQHTIWVPLTFILADLIPENLPETHSECIPQKSWPKTRSRKIQTGEEPCAASSGVSFPLLLPTQPKALE